MLLLIILIIVAVALLPRWPYSANWGNNPFGIIITILIIYVIYLLLKSAGVLVA